jgi:hypothetical protein
MVGNEIFQIDLGSVVDVGGVKVETTNNDYMRGYRVELSTDGASFAEAANGTGDNVSDVTFAKKQARYVRVVQTGDAGGAWWSIHELNVYCPTDDTCKAAGSAGAGQIDCPAN